VLSRRSCVVSCLPGSLARRHVTARFVPRPWGIHPRRRSQCHSPSPNTPPAATLSFPSIQARFQIQRWFQAHAPLSVALIIAVARVARILFGYFRSHNHSRAGDSGDFTTGVVYLRLSSPFFNIRPLLGQDTLCAPPTSTRTFDDRQALLESIRLQP
jgi:hypothetical protein